MNSIATAKDAAAPPKLMKSWLNMSKQFVTTSANQFMSVPAIVAPYTTKTLAARLALAMQKDRLQTSTLTVLRQQKLRNMQKAWGLKVLVCTKQKQMDSLST